MVLHIASWVFFVWLQCVVVYKSVHLHCTLFGLSSNQVELKSSSSTGSGEDWLEVHEKGICLAVHVMAAFCKQARIRLATLVFLDLCKTYSFLCKRITVAMLNDVKCRVKVNKNRILIFLLFFLHVHYCK